MPELGSIIREAASRYGVSPELMLRIAQIESGMNPQASNPNSSARGVYQFLTKPGGSWDRYGNGQNPLDATANVDAGARYIRDNTQALQTKLGRPPAPWEVYFAHQQGPAGGPALLQNPDRPAAEVLSAFYRNPKTARDAIALNGGNPDSPARDFASLWQAKFEGTPLPAGGRAIASASPAQNSGIAMPAGESASSSAVTNPNALAYGQANMMGSIFADMLKPPEKPVDPLSIVRKPKNLESVLGDLGKPVQLSA